MVFPAAFYPYYSAIKSMSKQNKNENKKNIGDKNMMNASWFGKAMAVAGMFGEFEMTGDFAQELHGYIDEVTNAFIVDLARAIALAGAIEFEAQGLIMPTLSPAVEAEANMEVYEARKAA